VNAASPGAPASAPAPAPPAARDRRALQPQTGRPHHEPGVEPGQADVGQAEVVGPAALDPFDGPAEVVGQPAGPPAAAEPVEPLEGVGARRLHPGVGGDADHPLARIPAHHGHIGVARQRAEHGEEDVGGGGGHGPPSYRPGHEPGPEIGPGGAGACVGVTGYAAVEFTSQ